MAGILTSLTLLDLRFVSKTGSSGFLRQTRDFLSKNKRLTTLLTLSNLARNVRCSRRRQWLDFLRYWKVSQALGGFSGTATNENLSFSALWWFRSSLEWAL